MTGCPITDCMTGAGSARPVVSITTRRTGFSRPVWIASIMPASVSTSSPLTVQQRQPLESCTSVSPEDSTRRLSIPTSPNSLMITAVSVVAGSFRIRLRRVDLPAPRKPVRMETGMRGVAMTVGGSKCRARQRDRHVGDLVLARLAGNGLGARNEARKAVLRRPRPLPDIGRADDHPAGIVAAFAADLGGLRIAYLGADVIDRFRVAIGRQRCERDPFPDRPREALLQIRKASGRERV